MRIWRDVISVTAWDQVAARVNTSSGYGKKLDWKLRAQKLVKHRYRSPEDFMASIGKRLRTYHAIPKTDMKQLAHRREALHELSRIAAEYLEVYDIATATAAHRVAVKDPVWGFDSNPANESVDRNILSLVRRAPRKAQYIDLLGQYYAKGGAGRKWRDATALIKFATDPQERTGSKLGLVPLVRMEQVDFMHRGDYEEIPGLISCHDAFKDWMSDANARNTPFFLWLEGHPVCLEDDKVQLSSQSVQYHKAAPGKMVDTLRKLKLVSIESSMQATDLTLANFPIATASTFGYTADPAKDPRQHTTGINVAAYVWTEARELFIAEHKGFNFHHSSFLSGARVRCAGMIVILNGKVVALSNSSGHYKPGKEHLLKFYMALRQANALPATATIHVFTPTSPPAGHKINANQFWSQYFTL